MTGRLYSPAPANVNDGGPALKWWVSWTRHVPFMRQRRACRRAHSEPARRSTPWKNGLSTWLRRPAQLCELRGSHVATPFYPAARVSRRSQARLSERALRHVSAEPPLRTRSTYGAVGDMLRQRTMRAARRTRQTGKHFGGVKAGQVTDLTGSHPHIPETCFPAPSSGSPSSMSPAAPHDDSGTTEPTGLDMRPNCPLRALTARRRFASICDGTPGKHGERCR